MSILNKKLTDFDEEDVKLLDEMLSKFHALKEKRGGDLPDYSPGYVAYFPALALALLKSQQAVGRLTRWLVGFTVVLVSLTIVLTYRTFA